MPVLRGLNTEELKVKWLMYWSHIVAGWTGYEGVNVQKGKIRMVRG